MSEKIQEQVKEVKKQEFANLTPVIPHDFDGFMDADDEMRLIAIRIKNTTIHNSDIEVDKIKFLYSTKNPAKRGGRYILATLIKRDDMEKMIDDSYDYIVTVFYDVWKDLNDENKILQLDKVLCGIDMGTLDSPKLGKKSYDTQEYNNNLRHFGAEKVLDSSEMVDLACQRIIEERKERKKEEKSDQKKNQD
jgi:hypothetical protein